MTNLSPVDAMTTDYRAMCAELVDSVELLLEMRAVDAKPMAITEDRLSRARALLAQPEPPELTDEKLLSLVAEVFGYVFLDGGIGGGESEFLAYARAADRARYGHSTPQPLPSGYIDPEHKGEDLALLETFYRACLAEGGTVNEIELRGIRAVLATHSTPQPEPAPKPPSLKEQAGDLALIEATLSALRRAGLDAVHENTIRRALEALDD